MKKKEIRIRCWVDVEGAKFFGPGPAELLRLIEDTGSIARAARSMGMSYKKAWDIVDRMNSVGRSPFVTSHKGGVKGGGARLTERGKKVLAAYNALTRKIHSVAARDHRLLKLI